MSSVAELREEALKRDADVSNLLHKALVLASMLNLRKLEEWVRLELSGYPSQEVPAYRQLRGQLKCRDAFGSRVVVLPWPELQVEFSTFPLREPVAQVQELLTNASGSFRIHWPDQDMMRRALDTNGLFYLEGPSSQLRRILDEVKVQILTWCLNLEKDGIAGDGGKQRAAQEARVTPTIIYNFIQKVESLYQTNSNSGDVNNAIQPN